MSNLISWNSLFTLFNLNIVTEFASDCSNLCFNQHFISGKYASLKHILKIREKPQIMEGHRSLVNSVMMYSSQESQRNFPKLNMKSTSKYMILKWPPKQNFNLKILSSCEKKILEYSYKQYNFWFPSKIFGCDKLITRMILCVTCVGWPAWMQPRRSCPGQTEGLASSPATSLRHPSSSTQTIEQQTVHQKMQRRHAFKWWIIELIMYFF